MAMEKIAEGIYEREDMTTDNGETYIFLPERLDKYHDRNVAIYIEEIE